MHYLKKNHSIFFLGVNYGAGLMRALDEGKTGSENTIIELILGACQGLKERLGKYKSDNNMCLETFFAWLEIFKAVLNDFL